MDISFILDQTKLFPSKQRLQLNGIRLSVAIQLWSFSRIQSGGKLCNSRAITGCKHQLLNHFLSSLTNWAKPGGKTRL